MSDDGTAYFGTMQPSKDRIHVLQCLVVYGLVDRDCLQAKAKECGVQDVFRLAECNVMAELVLVVVRLVRYDVHTIPLGSC